MSEGNGSPRPKLWRQGEGQSGQPPAEPPRKYRKIYVVLALLLALLGATAAWLCYPSRLPMPSFLGVWIDEYRDDGPIPVNAWAEQDRTALKQLPWEHINAFTSQERRLLRQVLEELQATERPIVVLISAHALTRPDGSVHLLPANARLEDEGTWLPLTAVLRFFHDCRSRHKLLILDLMQPFVDPRLGLIADDVSVRVRPVLEKGARDDPHLHILWACAPGQHSLSAEELGHSVFAYYLLEGLKGRAEGYAAPGRRGDRDGRISVTELALFVQARVDRWSRRTRGLRQTPQYLGKGEDFGLVAFPDQPPAAPAPPADAAYPDWLRKHWEKRDEWLGEPWPRLPPEKLRELEDALLRAESHLRAGVGPARVENAAREVLKRLGSWRDRWREAELPQRPTPSLAREVARGRQPPDQLAGGVLSKYRALLGLDAKLAATAKPAEQDQKRLADEQAALLKGFEGKPFELAWMAFGELAREPPAQRRVQFVAQFLAKGPPQPGYEEVAFVQRLADWKVEAKDWNGRLARLALRLAGKAAEVSALADDPGLLAWVKDRLKAARASRQTAERLLFDPGEMTAEEVNSALDAAFRAYQGLHNDLRTLAEAYRARDDALVRLPGYAPRLQEEPDEEPHWAKVIDQALALQKELQVPPPLPSAETFRKIGSLAGNLQDALKDTLQTLAEKRADELIGNSKKAGPDDWLKMNTLLQIPWLDAKKRADLWAAEWQLVNRLTQAVLQEDAKDDAAGRQTSAQPVDTRDAAKAAQKHALLRARVSLGLLRLGGAADLQGLKDAADRADAEPDDPAAWRDLSERLRQAWAALKAAAPAGGGERAP
jgi:hypothetical protein